MARSKGRILWCTKRLINDLHTQSCSTEIAFSALDCPRSFLQKEENSRQDGTAQSLPASFDPAVNTASRSMCESGRGQYLVAQPHARGSVEQCHKHRL